MRVRLRRLSGLGDVSGDMTISGVTTMLTAFSTTRHMDRHRWHCAVASTRACDDRDETGDEVKAPEPWPRLWIVAVCAGGARSSTGIGGTVATGTVNTTGRSRSRRTRTARSVVHVHDREQRSITGPDTTWSFTWNKTRLTARSVRVRTVSSAFACGRSGASGSTNDGDRWKVSATGVVAW